MTLRKTLVLLTVLLQSASAVYAVPLDMPFTRKYSYSLGISRAASYQLAPGDYLQIDVTSGPPEARKSQTIIKKVQVIRIMDTKTPSVNVSLAMNRGEIRKMQQALRQPNPSIALRIVKKQPRTEIGELPGDGVPDLDLEESTDLAQKPTPDN